MKNKTEKHPELNPHETFASYHLRCEKYHDAKRARNKELQPTGRLPEVKERQTK
jgi:hypothetical protein